MKKLGIAVAILLVVALGINVTSAESPFGGWLNSTDWSKGENNESNEMFPPGYFDIDPEQKNRMLVNTVPGYWNLTPDAWRRSFGFPPNYWDIKRENVFRDDWW